jgi:hypothetical protein
VSRTEAVEAYRTAHKKALKTYREDAEHGRWPYVQVLDDLLDGAHLAGRIELGVLQVPVDRIVGTVSDGRRSVFSRDFMPLPEPNTEFGTKWISLCEAHLDAEGIRIVKAMPKLQPAQLKGKAVRSKMMLVLPFRLK